MRRYLLLVLVGAVASLNASALLAQEEEPETRVITVTTFHVPFGEAFGEALLISSSWSIRRRTVAPGMPQPFRY